MKALTIILTTLVLLTNSATVFSQEEKKSLFEQISDDIGLDDSQLEPLKDIVMTYMKELAATVDKYDTDNPDVVAMFKDLKTANESYHNMLKTNFGEEKLELYKSKKHEYKEAIELITVYFRTITIQVKFSLSDEQIDPLMTAMELPVTKMLALYTVIDYIGGEEAMSEAVIAESKTGILLGREAEKVQMKEILSESQYQEWLE